MLYKKIFILIASVFFLSFSSNKEIESYEKALDKILESEQYASITNNKKKYHVSDEIIIFSKLGKFFREDLASDVSLSEEKIVTDGNKKNPILNMSKLNIKKCSKVQIYFSEIEQNIFFAELIPSKKETKYKDRQHFGISYIYMFRKNDDKIELLNVRQIDYN